MNVLWRAIQRYAPRSGPWAMTSVSIPTTSFIIEK
jgi:hypothetical protein